ncbi:MAG: M23 family metallopeptidase [Bacteroidota bacterium]
MARIKYYYNTETCNYERVETSKWDIFFDLLGFLSISLIIAICIFSGYSKYFDSPKELQLKQENALLKQHYDELQQAVEQSHQVLAHLQKQDDKLYRMLLEVEPLPVTVRKAGVGGINRYEGLMRQSELLANTTQKVDQLKRQLYIQSKSYEEVTQMAKNKEKMLACMPAIQPISHKGFKYISSPFGLRMHPIYKVPHRHTGVDIAAPIGTRIYATGDGVVKRVKQGLTGYGNYVDVEHGYGFMTRYGHMQTFTVKRGDRVKRGQCIGYVGNTGTSTGPHLHYEVRKNNRPVDPVHYFSSDIEPGEYEMLVNLAAQKIPVSQ